MDESYIFLDKGKDGFKVYNANKSIDVVCQNDDIIRIKKRDIDTNISMDKINIDEKIFDYDKLNFCSQYFDLNYSEERHEINIIYVFIQLIIVSIFYYFFWIGANLINIFTIDGACSAIIFILKYNSEKDDYLFCNIVYQTSYFVRLIYYFILIGCYYSINFITWYYFDNALQYVLLMFTLPIVIENIVYSYEFKKLTKIIRYECDEVLYFIISKQMTKIVSIISKKCLNYNPNFNENEFKPFVKKMSVGIFINFIGAFIFASILHYFERNGTTVFTAIFRQFYFRQYYFNKENIDPDHKKYIVNIMKTRNWIKLLDPYTLNRIMKMYLKLNEDSDDSIIIHIQNIFSQINASISKIMVCWTMSSLVKIRCIGIMTYLLFVKSKYKINMYLKFGIIIFFVIVSFFSYEQLLQIILCEICTHFMVNKVTRDIIYDIYKYIIHILHQNTSFYVQNNTIMLSCYLALSTISYSKFNVMITLFIMTVIIRLVKIWYPSDKIDRIFIGMICTLFFGYFSDYNLYHCLLLPYIFQLISSKENLMLLIKKKKII